MTRHTGNTWQRYEEGSPKNRIIFWQVSLSLYRLPLLGEYSRNPSVLVDQMASLWESVFGFFVGLFPWMKKVLEGKPFANVEEVKQKTAAAVLNLPININEFKNCFEWWKKCLDGCIASNGEYFEGNWSLNT